VSDDLVKRLRAFALASESVTDDRELVALLREASERIEYLEQKVSDAEDDAWEAYRDGKAAALERER